MRREIRYFFYTKDTREEKGWFKFDYDDELNKYYCGDKEVWVCQLDNNWFEFAWEDKNEKIQNLETKKETRKLIK